MKSPNTATLEVTDFAYCAPLKPVTTVQKSANSANSLLEKPPAKAVFFVWLKIRSPILASRNRMRRKIMQTLLYQPSIFYSLGMMADEH